MSEQNQKGTNLRTQGLIERIKGLKKAHNAIILAHNYQPPEIQDLGDYIGDSLNLCRKAATSDAEVICFCGVRFMAESAAIINPKKRVILPAPEAGCSLADDLKIETLKRLQADHPDAATVCYVNSSAEVKAMSYICCTSANAIKVVNTLQNYKEIIFVPDMNLGHYVSLHTDKRLYLTNINCNIHNVIKKEDILAAKALHPKAKLIVHPECKPDVVAQADCVASTSQMSKYIMDSGASEFIIATEIGMLYPLSKSFPSFKFYPVSDKMLCKHMKLITLEKLASSLETLKPEIEVPEAIRIKAKQALDRMLEIT